MLFIVYQCKDGINVTIQTLNIPFQLVQTDENYSCINNQTVLSRGDTYVIDASDLKRIMSSP